MQRKENIFKDYAKTGSLIGGLFGLGLGTGAGVMFNSAGNFFGRVVLPIATSFYSKWDLTQPGLKLPYERLMKTLVPCAAGGAAIGASAGLIVGTATASVRFFASKESVSVVEYDKKNDEPKIK
jgi:hypothetical protein